ncbi:hypothetical protein HYH03_012252 [Edaphochlamys debaryana]|uniref:Thioesterase domain-containing protein n=1 Tax=Edaphochlamys debaryana TaxID=47281 RepID=A0A835XYJ5_9CHLO|nr:hypothetical protein HYH03_012252 [Edaphochlamys debaryana]|eukprot:KAG2489230.1 hypothetical protein HYH03_012252 [Edaphochlamys debaryana]
MRRLTSLGRLASGLQAACSSSLAAVERVAWAVHVRGFASTEDASISWRALQQQGVKVNPCNSPHHPAAKLAPPAGEELSVQEAYNNESTCFGCGPSHPEGLKLKSRRMGGAGLGRLQAEVSFDPKYCAFPGIVNGGIISTVMDCHGNWAAAVALMDKGCLPRPPLTLTATMAVSYKETTPPSTPLLLRSRVLSIKEGHHGPGPKKSTIEVEVTLSQAVDAGEAMVAASDAAAAGAEGGPAPEPGEKILAVGRGVFKQLGALRSL